MKNIGLGTAAIGRPHYINIRQEATSGFTIDAFREKGIAVLEAAYKQGVRYFDTAPGYGMAEQMVLDWIKEKKDASIEVATKWGYTYVADFNPDAVQHEVKEHSLDKLNEQWQQSEKLLPSLSTYQIHSATFETGVLENKAILNRLSVLKKKHGLNIGITTSGHNQVAVIKKAAEVTVEGEPLFSSFQVTYNILDQSFAALATLLAAQKKRIIIKEALANGRIFPNKKYPHYTRMYEKLEALAAKYQVGTDAIALRFCLDSIPVFSVLSGAANEAHLSDNLKALHFELEKDDIAVLKKMAITPEAYWQERKQLGWN